VDPFIVRTIMVYNYTIKPLQLFTLLVALFGEYLYLMFQKMTHNSQHYFTTVNCTSSSTVDGGYLFNVWVHDTGNTHKLLWNHILLI